MARERIWLDDWELTTGVTRDWETLDGLDGISMPSGVNTRIPGHPGETWVPKQTGPGSFTISLWVAGTNRAEALAAWQEVVRAAYRPHRQVYIRRLLPSGELVFARGELSAAVQPTWVGEQGARASLTFSVDSGIWESVTIYEHNSPGGAALPVSVPLTDLAPSTAAMDKLWFRIYGPITNPMVVDTTDGEVGEWFRYTGVIPAGQSIEINCWTYDIEGHDGFAPNPNALTYMGARYLLVPAARPGQTPRVELRGSGIASSTRLQVFGHRAYAT